MKTNKTYFKMQSGTMIFTDKGKWFQFIKNLKDGLYELKVDMVFSNRSSQQNKYYWGVIVPACKQGLEEQGTDACLQEAHNTLKAECNYQELVNEQSGEILKVVKSTANRNTKEFLEYVEKCRRFIREWFNIETPDPE